MGALPRARGALLAVVLAACSAAPSPASATTTTSAAATASVTIVSGFAFEPAAISVTRGTKVTWTNSSSTTHTVTSGAPDKPTNVFNHAVEAGKTFAITFNDAGTFDYFCSIHQTMHGTVIVK